MKELTWRVSDCEELVDSECELNAKRLMMAGKLLILLICHLTFNQVVRGSRPRRTTSITDGLLVCHFFKSPFVRKFVGIIHTISWKLTLQSRLFLRQKGVHNALHWQLNFVPH